MLVCDLHSWDLRPLGGNQVSAKSLGHSSLPPRVELNGLENGPFIFGSSSPSRAWSRFLRLLGLPQAGQTLESNGFDAQVCLTKSLAKGLDCPAVLYPATGLVDKLQLFAGLLGKIVGLNSSKDQQPIFVGIRVVEDMHHSHIRILRPGICSEKLRRVTSLLERILQNNSSRKVHQLTGGMRPFAHRLAAEAANASHVTIEINQNLVLNSRETLHLAGLIKQALQEFVDSETKKRNR